MARLLIKLNIGNSFPRRRETIKHLNNLVINWIPTFAGMNKSKIINKIHF